MPRIGGQDRCTYEVISSLHDLVVYVFSAECLQLILNSPETYKSPRWTSICHHKRLQARKQSSCLWATKCFDKSILELLTEEKDKREIKHAVLAVHQYFLLLFVRHTVYCGDLVNGGNDVFEGVGISFGVVAMIKLHGNPLAKNWDAEVLRIWSVNYRYPVLRGLREAQDSRRSV